MQGDQESNQGDTNGFREFRRDSGRTKMIQGDQKQIQGDQEWIQGCQQGIQGD